MLLAALLLASAISRNYAAADDQGLPAELTAGQSLESALAALNERGHRITFSTALVRPDMRLAESPSSGEIEALLVELLAPWGLVAERMPDGAYRVVRAPGPVGGHAAGSDSGVIGQLSQIDVTASRFALLDATASTPFLDRPQIEAYPHLTDDAFRALRVLPGVAGGDFSARLYLRGGRRDEVALRVDGVEIHDPFHLRELDGPISLLDTNLVERIDLTTGGPTADFGGRMSGLVDITTRIPQAGATERNAVGISFVNAFARTSGRFADDRGYYLLAARRGYLDLVLQRVEDNGEEFAPRYQDLLATAGYALDDRTNVSLNLLLGSDDMTYVTADDEKGSAGKAHTAHAWVTHDHAFEGGLHVVSVAAAGNVDQTRNAFDDEPDKLLAALDMARELRFASLRQDWSWQLSGRHLLRWGANADRYRADYDYSLFAFILDPVISGGTPIDHSHGADLVAHTDELGVYAAWRARLAPGLFGEAGLRWDRYGGDLDATRVSPRVNLVYDPGGTRQYRLALSRTFQPQRADELQVEDDVTRFFPPERADQLSLGMTQRIGSRATLRADLYVKHYDDLHARFENLLDSLELINEAQPDRLSVEASEARAYGAELSLQAKASASTNFWASYVYSRTEDQLADGWTRRLWDQPHALTAGFAWTGSKWRLSVAANWHSGWPTTPVTVQESVGDDGQTVVSAIVGRRNSERLGSFRRVDLRASRSLELEHGSLTWYLEVYNLFDSRNPCCVEDFDLVRDGAGRLVAIPNEDYWLPILPSFGIQFEF